MEEYAVRLILERDELSERLDKLNDFITGCRVFNFLQEAERTRLTKQADIMKDYLDILNERITSLPKWDDVRDGIF